MLIEMMMYSLPKSFRKSLLVLPALFVLCIASTGCGKGENKVMQPGELNAEQKADLEKATGGLSDFDPSTEQRGN